MATFAVASLASVESLFNDFELEGDCLSVSSAPRMSSEDVPIVQCRVGSFV